MTKPKLGTTASTRRNRIAYEDDEDEDEDIVPIKAPRKKSKQESEDEDEDEAKKPAFSIFKKVANKKKIGLWTLLS